MTAFVLQVDPRTALYIYSRTLGSNCEHEFFPCRSPVNRDQVFRFEVPKEFTDKGILVRPCWLRYQRCSDPVKMLVNFRNGVEIEVLHMTALIKPLIPIRNHGLVVYTSPSMHKFVKYLYSRPEDFLGW